MAWVTTIGPDAAQVEYRLQDGCGCDAQVEYRLGFEAELEWIGRGLADVGLEAGAPVDKAAARLLAEGRHPQTGERLLRPKLAVDPRGKLGAREVVDALHLAAVERGVEVAELLGDDERLVKRFARLERGLRREGEAHRVPVVDVEKLTAAAGVDVEALYEAEHLAEARKHAGARVRVGNRGYDLVLDLSKSYTALVGLASPEVAAELRALYLQAARETVAAMEDWAVYSMAGHHGDGQRAERVATHGALGWMTVHESARPVDGEVGDPHLHVHVTLANMALGADGQWRTIGAGGRDIHRHAHAADSLVKARLRALTAERFGMRWERAEATGAWEVVGVPLDLRRALSRRSEQVAATTRADATTGEKKLAAAQLAERKQTGAPADVRAAWRARAETVVADVDAMVAEAIPGPPPPAGPGIDGPGTGPLVPTPQEIAAHIWREGGGLTEHRKTVTRADVLAAVIDAVPGGVADVRQADRLTDEVLAVAGHAVALPSDAMAHMTNAQRYTHVSVLDAERTIVESATARLSEGTAELTAEAAELAVSAFEAARGFELSKQQRGVVARLLTAGHGLDVVVGVAGAGKTTLMAAARAGWEAAGLRVAGASTAAVAASNLQAEAGITSGTVAALVADIEAGGRRMADADVLVLDEAGVVDDRALATILRAAAEAGTKVVALGDWQQLRAIGVGGGFRRAHQLVGGETLTENRRQTDPAVRHLLEVWREGGRKVTLAGLAEHGHVHAAATAEEARAEMLSAWWERHQAHTGDAHDLVDGLLVLAAKNSDVEALNAGARELLRAAGKLTGGRTYATAGGERVEFAPGDLVRVRRNDYGSRRPGGVDVLNGYRGEVVSVSAAGVRIRWRRTGPDGPEHQEAVVSARSIAAGALSHGYAMTIAAAQGLTADHALVYGPGADAYSLYPAITRARHASHLWLPTDVVEYGDPAGAAGGAAHRDRAAAPRGDRVRGLAGPGAGRHGLRRAGRAGHAGAAPRRTAGRGHRGAGTPAAGTPGRPGPAGAGDGAAHGTRPAPPRAAARTARGRPPPGGARRGGARVAAAAVRQRRTARLESTAAAYDGRAEEARQRQPAAQADAERLQEVIGTAQSPAAQRHADRVQQLVGAEGALARAAEADRQADVIGDRMRELYDVNSRERAIEQRITARASTKWSAVTFQRGGMQEAAAELRARADARVREIAGLREESTRLRGEAMTRRRDAERAADALEGSRSYKPTADRLAGVRADLPQYAVRADARDRQVAEQTARRAVTAGQEVERWTTAAAGVRAEAELREGLSPERQTRETAERVVAARTQAAQRQEAARQADLQRPATTGRRTSATTGARHWGVDPPPVRRERGAWGISRRRHAARRTP